MRVWYLYLEEFEDLQPNHLYSVRGGLKILKVITEGLNYSIILIRTLFICFGDSRHYKRMLLLISSRIKAHLGGNV